jgi:FkbM family methyltransferase
MTINKIKSVIARDGLIFTAKRTLACLIGKSPLAYKLSFKYQDNLRLVFAPSMLTYVLFASKNTRANDVDIINRFVKQGDTVIDVGAHIGSMSLVAATLVGTNGQVIAFEPVPKFFSILNANIKLNKLESRITAYPYAVGEKKDTVYMDDNVTDDTTNHVSSSGKEVEQIDLDSMVEKYQKIDLLKIDVEGYETEVLRGAKDTLNKTEIIFIEFYTKNLRSLGHNPNEVITILTTHFNIFIQDSNYENPFIFSEDKDYEINLVGIKK